MPYEESHSRRRLNHSSILEYGPPKYFTSATNKPPKYRLSGLKIDGEKEIEKTKGDGIGSRWLHKLLKGTRPKHFLNLVQNKCERRNAQSWEGAACRN